MSVIERRQGAIPGCDGCGLPAMADLGSRVLRTRTLTLTSLGMLGQAFEPHRALDSQLNQGSLGVFRQPHRLPTPQWVDQHSPPCGAAQRNTPPVQE
jgi:hypothetical protein